MNKHLTMIGVSFNGVPFKITTEQGSGISKKDIGLSRKELKMSGCKNKAADFKGGIVELNEFLVCGDCDYLCQCLVPQYLMEK